MTGGPVFRLAVAGWIGWCVSHLGAPLDAWGRMLGELIAPPRAALWPPGLPGLARHAGAILLAGWLAAVFISAGRPVRRVLRARGPAPGGFGWLSGLLGFQVVGAVLLALGLTGLYRLPLLLLVAALPLVVRPAGGRRPLVRAGWAEPVAAWRWIIAMPPLVALPLLLLPAVHHDALYCHLAIPASCLALGRFITEHRQMGFTYPVPAELVSGLPLAAGLPGAVNLVHAIPFGCAVLGFGRAVTRAASPGAGTVAMWALAAMGTVYEVAVLGKPDLAFAAYPVAAAALLLSVRGPLPGSVALTAAVLFGCGAATKWPGWIFLVAGLGWIGMRAAPRRAPPFFALALGALVPAVPWIARNWLLLGDPFWPFASRWIPGALWDQASQAAQNLLTTDRRGAGTLPGRVVLHWLDRMPLVVWTLPWWPRAFRSMPPRLREPVAFGAIAGALPCLLHPTDGMRYALPGWLLMAAPVAAELERRSARGTGAGRIAMTGLLFAAATLPLGGALLRSVSPATALAHLLGRLDAAGYRQHHLPAYARMQQAVGAASGGGAVLLLGEERSFGISPRALTERFPGRDPAWVLATECATPEAMRKRLRQWDVETVIANLSVQFDPYRYLVPYEWNRPMLRRWRVFVGAWLVVAVPPPIFFSLDGGFCVYRVRTRPAPHPEPVVPWLPGADAAYAQVTRHALTGDLASWVADARRIVALLPDVQQAHNLLAVGLLSTGRPGEALAEYFPGIRAGWLDEENLLGFARAARDSGRMAESVAAATQAAAAYPDRTEEARALLPAH